MRFPCIYILLLVFISCTKNKEQKTSALNEVEFHIINQGDPNVQSFNITSEVFNWQNGYSGYHHQVFLDVKPFDTVIVKIGNPGFNLIPATRYLKFRVGFKNKVFSPLLFSYHVLVDGNPYDYGWAYMRAYANELHPDTIRSISDKIYYYYWPADSLKLAEVLY